MQTVNDIFFLLKQEINSIVLVGSTYISIINVTFENNIRKTAFNRNTQLLFQVVDEVKNE